MAIFAFRSAGDHDAATAQIAADSSLVILWFVNELPQQLPQRLVAPLPAQYEQVHQLPLASDGS